MMMKLKQFIAIFLSLSILPLFSIQYTNADEEYTTARTVICQTTDERAEYYLEGLGIDTQFKTKEFITRGEFAALIVEVSYNDIDYRSDEAIFEDVSLDYEYADDIYFACKMGIVSKNNVFRPDDYIKPEEALTMAINALGYSFMAKQNGGYPVGYLMTAASTGLSKNVVTSAQTFSGTDALTVLYNMLNIDVINASIQGGKIVYTKEANTTILTERYGLTSIEGVITANSYSDLNGNQKISSKRFIKIDGREFKYERDAYDLLGMRVIAYFDEEDNAVIVCPIFNEVVDSNNVYDFSGNLLKCEDGDNIKQFKFDKSFCFIYNGRAYPYYTVDDIKNINGGIRLIDNDSDGDYDVVSVTDIEYMTVTTIDRYDKKMYGKAINIEFISFDEEKTIVDFYRHDVDGSQRISVNDIFVDDVVALKISKDKAVGRVEVCSAEIYGEITEMETGYITVDGQKYEVSDYFKNYSKATVGINGTFKLGLMGELLTLNTAADSEFLYGYIIRTDRDDKDIFGDSLYVKMIDEEGNIVNYKLANKLMIDGKWLKISKKSDTDVSKIRQRQLIRYKLGDNVITAIDTAYNATSIDEESNNTNDCLIKYHSLEKAIYKGQLKSFLRFYVSGATKVFVVPDLSVSDVEDEDFGIGDISYFGGKDTTINKLDVFDFDSNGIPNIIVCYDSYSMTIDNSSPFGVVEKITTAWNEEQDMSCYKLSIWLDGVFKDYYVDPDVDAQLIKSTGKMIAEGDIVGFVLKNGMIKKLDIYYDADSDVNDFTDKGISEYVKYDSSFNIQRAFVKASIYRKRGDNYIISWTKNSNGNGYDYSLDSLRTVAIGNSTSIVVVDKTVHPIYKDEVLDYYSASDNADVAVFVQGYWSCSNVIIYRR